MVGSHFLLYCFILSNFALQTQKSVSYHKYKFILTSHSLFNHFILSFFSPPFCIYIHIYPLLKQILFGDIFFFWVSYLRHCEIVYNTSRTWQSWHWLTHHGAKESFAHLPISLPGQWGSRGLEKDQRPNTERLELNPYWEQHIPLIGHSFSAIELVPFFFGVWCSTLGLKIGATS